MITPEEVRKVAELAKLNFTDNKIAELSKDLTNIMNMVDDLNNIDCSNIKPLHSVCNTYQRLRSDEVTSSDMSAELFSNTSSKDGNIAKEIKCFIVPKVVE